MLIAESEAFAKPFSGVNALITAYLTSFAVTGVPSENLVSFKWNVQVKPSSLPLHLSAIPSPITLLTLLNKPSVINLTANPEPSSTEAAASKVEAS